jgi:hypothetical protein
MGMEPSRTSYDDRDYKSITASYVPARGHQYRTSSGTQHVWIVTSVRGPENLSNGVKRWTLKNYDINGRCDNVERTWTSYFETQTTKGVTKVKTWPQSSYSAVAKDFNKP